MGYRLLLVVGVLLTGRIGAQGPDLVVERDAVIARIQGMARDGIAVAQLRATYNHLAHKLGERYPQLPWLAAMAKVPLRYDDDLELSRALIRGLDDIDLGALGLDRRTALSARSHLATWLRAGRVPLRDLTEWRLLAQSNVVELPPPDPKDLLFLRGVPAAPEVAARPKPPPPKPETTSRPGKKVDPVPGVQRRPPPVTIDPKHVALGLVLLEDFLVSYRPYPEKTPAITAEELSAAMRRSVELAGATKETGSLDTVEASPPLVAGIARLFRDLCVVGLGVDPERVQALVQELPDDQKWTLAISGYGVAAGEPAGLAYLPLTIDVFQLIHGQRMPVVWLRHMKDLEKVLLDPEVKRLVLIGHGSMEAYGFEGLTGPPTETLARLLAWCQGHVAPLVDATLPLIVEGKAGPLDRLLRTQLDAGWRHWRYQHSVEVARRPEFVKKEAMIFCACSVFDTQLRPVAPLEGEARATFESEMARVLREEARRIEGGTWVDFEVMWESKIFLWPLSPAHVDAYQRHLPELLARVQRRLPEQPFVVSNRSDFTELLARERGRFPGTAWIHDYLLNPRGIPYERERLLTAIRKALETAAPPAK